MKPFEEWSKDLVRDVIEQITRAHEPEFPCLHCGVELNPFEDYCEDCLDFGIDDLANMRHPCRVCGEMCDINCEPEEFDESMHYCGGSPSCCP